MSSRLYGLKCRTQEKGVSEMLQRFALYAKLCNENGNKAHIRELEKQFAKEMMQEYGWELQDGKWVEVWEYEGGSSILMEVLHEEYDRLNRQVVVYQKGLEEYAGDVARCEQLQNSIKRAKRDRMRLKRILQDDFEEAIKEAVQKANEEIIDEMPEAPEVEFSPEHEAKMQELFSKKEG